MMSPSEVCALHQLFPKSSPLSFTDQLHPLPPPRHQLPLLPPSRGRHRRASDSGTSSCSPIRRRCVSKTEETNPGMVCAGWLNDTTKSLIADKQPRLFRTIPRPCASDSLCSQRTMPCSRSRICWMDQQSFSIHLASWLLFFPPCFLLFQEQRWRVGYELLEDANANH